MLGAPSTRRCPAPTPRLWRLEQGLSSTSLDGCSAARLDSPHSGSVHAGSCGRIADANRAVRACVQAEREALRRSGTAAAGPGRSGLGLPLLPRRSGARGAVDWVVALT